MPDPQQHQQHPVSSRGLKLFRSVGKRLVRTERKSSGDDSSSSSGNESKNPQSDSGRSKEVAESRLSGETIENKNKRVSLQVDATDSSSEGTSSSSSSQIISALGKVLRSLTIGEKKKNKTKKRPQQKSILRRPVPHTYVRGVNGLPQRVPLNRDYYRQKAFPPPHPRVSRL